MNRINQLFKEKEKNILSIYFTAGYPQRDDTATVLAELSNSGADMVEIGMPFSDPLADGPTIQRSSEIALQNGMSIRLLFEQLKTVSTSSVLILMGYLNPVLQFGMEEFCKQASALGISGLILPDLPLQEYLDHYKLIFERYGLKNIFLVTPQTSESRIRLIDEHSAGFIYLVSSASTTGSKSSISEEQVNYFKRIKAMNLNNPLIIGFGISDRETFSKACEYASGAIIGSAFVKAISAGNDLRKDVRNFMNSIVIPTNAEESL
jgi:tryptophan synthase alpha chain